MTNPKRSLRRRLATLVILPAVLAAERPVSQPLSHGIRCLVLQRRELDPSIWRAMSLVGANLVATAGPPDPQIDRAAGDAGLTYLAFLTTAEIPGFIADVARVAEAKAERNLAGFYYWDAGISQEGFTSPESQQFAYTTLKGLFPDKLVLFPTRLDPIVWSPDFLDRYFRPAYTDLVTPYYYPVGTTFIGEAREDGEWRERLGGLLAALAARVPPGKGILPVLQGYEQPGYPVSARFPSAQMMVYRQFWPALADVAVEAWELPGTEPLVELADLPTLQKGVCGLFADLEGVTARCPLRPALGWR